MAALELRVGVPLAFQSPYIIYPCEPGTVEVYVAVTAPVVTPVAPPLAPTGLAGLAPLTTRTFIRA